MVSKTTEHPPTPSRHTLSVHTVLWLCEGGRGGEVNQREGYRGNSSQSLGQKYQHDWHDWAFDLFASVDAHLWYILLYMSNMFWHFPEMCPGFACILYIGGFLLYWHQQSRACNLGRASNFSQHPSSPGNRRVYTSPPAVSPGPSICPPPFSYTRILWPGGHGPDWYLRKREERRNSASFAEPQHAGAAATRAAKGARAANEARATIDPE